MTIFSSRGHREVVLVAEPLLEGRDDLLLVVRDQARGRRGGLWLIVVLGRRWKAFAAFFAAFSRGDFFRRGLPPLGPLFFSLP
jgi:hypothetical protein